MNPRRLPEEVTCDDDQSMLSNGWTATTSSCGRVMRQRVTGSADDEACAGGFDRLRRWEAATGPSRDHEQLSCPRNRVGLQLTASL